MTFPVYPEYKNSGIDWLQEVPKSWDIKPLKYLLTLNPRKSGFDGDKQQVCSFVPMEKLKTGEVILDEQRLIDEVIGGYTFFQDGDVLQAKVTPCFENKNVALAEGLVNGVGFGSSEINVLRPSNQVDPKYLFYRVQEDAYMDVCTASMIGAGGLRRVPSEVINNFAVAVPPIEDQVQVARFLDHETAKIDALIREQERLIELLQEKRQAVISHAVTKGLDPDVPMKDSGVEWLGEVPAHWDVTRIGWKCAVGNGCTPSRDRAEYWQEGRYPWLNSSVVNQQRVKYSDQFVTDQALKECALPRVRKGSVLIAITGEGKTRGMTTITEIDATINQHIAFIEPRDTDLSSVFLHDWLVANYHQLRFESNGYGSTKAAITCGDIRAYPLPLPPLIEQGDISDFLENKSSQFDELIASAKKSVALLTERRSALISAAVTGKIDVRGWQPPKDESAFDEDIHQTGLETTA